MKATKTTGKSTLESDSFLSSLPPAGRSQAVWEVVSTLSAHGLLGDLNSKEKVRQAAADLEVAFLTVWGPATGEFDEQDLGEWKRIRWGHNEVGR